MQAKNLAGEDFFSSRLSQAMDTAGITQARLAERSGLTAPYISELRKGRKQNPSPEVAGKLAAALGCSPAWLLHGTGDPPDPDATPHIAEEPRGHYGSPPDPSFRPPQGLGLDTLSRDALALLLQRGAASLARTRDPADDLATASHLRALAAALESQSLQSIAAGYPETPP